MKLDTPDNETLPETSDVKKTYDPPELTVFGDMQTITQDVFPSTGADTYGFPDFGS